MSRKLEEYLKRERETLDVESPDDDAVWGRIEAGLSKKARRISPGGAGIRWIRIRNIAAAAIIMFCIGYITKDLVSMAASRCTVTLSSIDSRLGQREDQYRTMVKMRTEEVGMLQYAGNDMTEGLFAEMAELDTLYNQSMADLRELGANEKVVNMIFSIYEQKIRLLELIILETNKTNIHENNENVTL